MNNAATVIREAKLQEQASRWLESGDLVALTRTFHRRLCDEVTRGNPFLTPADQNDLQSHYGRILNPHRYPPPLVEKIYCARRAPALAAARSLPGGIVLDAGCAYGSESFLFAAQNRHVLAIDRCAEKIRIARRRKAFFEEFFGIELSVEFKVANLNEFVLDRRDVSLTWIASVLAVIRDQQRLLQRIHEATRPGGKIMITDMNLRNPLFLLSELKRRRLARQPDDRDVEERFFSGRALSRLLEQTGFSVESVQFSGFLPPFTANRWTLPIESICAAIPGLRSFGYFYLTTARVDASDGTGTDEEAR